MIKTIHIANDFSKYPSGRFESIGPNSGERFRNEILIPAIQENDKVIIILDGVKGYPPAFTEEAFGGAVRAGVDKQTLLNKLDIQFDSLAYDGYRDEIIEYIENAVQG